jgi:CelD/BcsL family acetyltransferase involved in cellulose biosynthesis
MHPYINGEKLKSLSGLLQRGGYRKHVNWFNRQGTLTYSCTTKPLEIKALLPQLFRLHMSEWAARGETSQFVHLENQQFYECLLEELGPSGAVRLDMLALSGRIIAAHFGFLWAGRFYYYKPAFDPGFSGHSPGNLLLAHLLNETAAQDVREFDLLFGVEPYKLNFASGVRPTGSIRVVRSWSCWLRLRAAALHRMVRRQS